MPCIVLVAVKQIPQEKNALDGKDLEQAFHFLVKGTFGFSWYGNPVFESGRLSPGGHRPTKGSFFPASRLHRLGEGKSDFWQLLMVFTGRLFRVVDTFF